MSDTRLSAEVLGKLLVAVQTLDALPGVKGMAEFLQSSLREVPGITNAFMCLNGEFPSADQATIAKRDLHCAKAAGLSASTPLCVLEDRPHIQLVTIRTPRQAFGCLQLVVDDEAKFEAYQPFLVNIGHMVATILEKRENDRSLATANAQLSRQAFESARSMIESSLDSLVAISPEGMITDVNEATVKVTGIPRDELIGTAFSECFTEPGKANAIYQLVFEQGMAVDYPLTIRHRDGTLTEVLYNASVYRDAGGKVLGVFAAARDVTEQNRAAETARSLVAAEDLVRTVMGSASIGIALAGLDGSFQVVNRAFCDLIGYDEAWFLAHRDRDIVHPDDAEEVLLDQDRIAAEPRNIGATTVRLVRADGTTVWVRRVGVLLRDGDGQPNLIMVQAEDITAEHEAQEALTYQAFHDSLTGLHNRAWILDILAVDLRAAKRLGHSVGALFVDLDNFKVVNDSLGHAAGDEVLATVAKRIMAALRPGDRVGRFGGDEFVILVQNAQDVLAVERCAERVSAAIATDLQVRGHRIVPTASIGIATSTSTSTPESLLRDADSALSQAKTNGQAGWHFFDETMHAQALARLNIEDQLREAITTSQTVSTRPRPRSVDSASGPIAVPPLVPLLWLF